MKLHARRTVAIALTVLVQWTTQAQIDVGSDGSDGAFNPTSNIEIDLALAPSGQWTKPAPTPGRGVYDPEQWAIVFKYSSINIPANVTVTFKNHPSRAPVIWLVDGNATIAGTVNVDGKAGHPSGGQSFAEPGPGGFRGSRGWVSSILRATAGFGPGGSRMVAPGCIGSPGASYGASGQPATLGTSAPVASPYGNSLILPLLGGSAGSSIDRSIGCPGSSSGGGGAGAGAILIAADGVINLNGSIRANGGAAGFESAAGSGGAVRIVADVVQGTGSVRALPGTGGGFSGLSGNGRIRVEANSINLTDVGIPAYSAGLPGNPPAIFPPPAAPKVKVISVAGQNVDSDPWARLDFPMQDLSLSSANPSLVVVQAQNVPLNWTMAVRLVPVVGADINLTAVAQPGSTAELSTWHATINTPSGFSVVQARAFAP